MTTGTLFTNAHVLTCDGAMNVHAPGHVLVEGERIRLVGPGPGPLGQAETVIDCAGDIVMPAMVNPHCHMPMTLFRGLAEDVDERLFRYVLPLERRFVTPETVRVGARLAALELIEGGTGTVADMYYFEEEIAWVLDETGLRGLPGQTVADFDPPDHRTPAEGLARFERFAADWRGHPRVTPTLAPHAPYSTGPQVMAACARLRDETGLPVQIHLAEMDSEMEWCARHHGCRPVELVRRAGLLDRGLIAAHCLHVDEAEIALMAARGVGVAHNARSNAKAGRGIAPVAAMRQAGIRVGIATDGPMSGNGLDAFAQFGTVAMFQKLLGRSRRPMPAQDVIRMATIEGAEVLGLAGRTGSLEAGKAADLIRVSLARSGMRPLYDPYAQLVFSGLATDVRDLMVDGRFLMRDRGVLTLDRDEAMAGADRVATGFRAEMARL